MNHVFVWTFGDVYGLVLLGLFLAVTGAVVAISLIERATKRIFRNRK